MILASFVNMFGGFAMLKVDPIPLAPRYWVPVAVAMIIGSVVGALTLKVIPSQSFDLVLGVAFLMTGFWFFFRAASTADLSSSAPTTASSTDLGVGTFAGFCGGFIGVNAPPLVLHFGRHLNKRFLRRLLVLIFIPAAISQTATFAISGMLNEEIIILGVLILPAMVLGIHLGNKAFFLISETTFRRILGVLLVVIATRLILRTAA